MAKSFRVRSSFEANRHSEDRLAQAYELAAPTRRKSGRKVRDDDPGTGQEPAPQGLSQVPDTHSAGHRRSA